MIYLLLSLSLGAIAVIQGGLNRQITQSWGLTSAISFNSIVTLVIAALFTLMVVTSPQSFSVELGPKVDFSKWHWWYLLPGVFGFALITGIPLAIPKIGALEVFLGMVVGMIVTSIAWDYYAESISLDPKRIIGSLLAILGLVITNWR